VLRRSFTLIELVIAIILVSIVYTFAINSFKKPHVVGNVENLTLNNLKDQLLKVDFNSTIEMQCNTELDCFILIDNVVQEEKISHLLPSVPQVYSYKKEYSRIDFPILELENMEYYNIVFKFKCTKDQKCSEYIVDFDDSVYIYNNLKRKPTVLRYMSDVDDYFTEQIKEVQDAI
jgi:prepilin-type N-terminal cleavage/methylation domain-containing protein